ncbi:CbrC family protein [Streptomyces sp. NPDC018019]|uniref:CbrC family protein n=1 Tax=Streptomyces sp. NPDC018019 TaxID=3365030 RepID=UPI0037B8CE20
MHQVQPGGRGYLYTGPIYTAADVDDGVCPWCIADGSAARQYDAQFTGGPSDDILDAIWEALSTRTPGYSSWQGDGDWLVHCGDGAAFLGPVGARELAGYPDAVEALRQETADWGESADDVERYLTALDKDGWATAYLFRCRIARCTSRTPTSPERGVQPGVGRSIGPGCTEAEEDTDARQMASAGRAPDSGRAAVRGRVARRLRP